MAKYKNDNVNPIKQNEEIATFHLAKDLEILKKNG